MADLIRRSIRARPPVIGKTNLLVYLHRLDKTEHHLKSKSIQDCVDICIGNKEDFKSEHIREAITIMIQDAGRIPLPVQIMRTAIRAFQSRSDLSKFILEFVIPALIKMRMWSSEPRIWDGVCFSLKTLAQHKDAEPTLRALFALPGPEFNKVIKVTTVEKVSVVKKPLAKLLKSFSQQENHEVLSGKWLFGPDFKDYETSGGHLNLDSEKQKILKELRTKEF